MIDLSVITTSRADYSSYRPVLREMARTDGFHFNLIVSGAHLEEQFGRTVEEIEQDGFPIGFEIPIDLRADTPTYIVDASSRALAGFGKALELGRPRMLMVLGDRFEMHAAALAALHFLIPVVHIHGGELTLGAIDDSLRHSITKLSHLHFASTAEYAKRIVRLGEEPWRVTVSGAPSLDNLRGFRFNERADLEVLLRISLENDPLIVTYHPATLDPAGSVDHLESLLQALSGRREPIVFTGPNADTGSSAIRSRITRFVREHPSSAFVENLGPEGYYGLMSHARAMVGNSSSGIIEAASFRLPVLNIGPRQSGRIAGRNVLSVDGSLDEIERGLHRITSDGFRESLKTLENPYGNGNSAKTIIARLLEIRDDPRIIRKQFFDAHSVDDYVNES